MIFRTWSPKDSQNISTPCYHHSSKTSPLNQFLSTLCNNIASHSPGKVFAHCIFMDWFCLSPPYSIKYPAINLALSLTMALFLCSCWESEFHRCIQSGFLALPLFSSWAPQVFFHPLSPVLISCLWSLEAPSVNISTH
jgi:hypothetical protein